MLNNKQKRFCQEYIIDLNATQAAIRAGYKEKTAYSQGQRLLKHVEIQKNIQKAQEKRSIRTEITQDMVLKELAKIGFTDMRNYSTWGSNGVILKQSDELTPEQTAAISEVSETISKNGGSIKFKLHDKVSALEKIGRHLGMFNDKLQLDGDIKFEMILVDGKKDGKPEGKNDKNTESLED